MDADLLAAVKALPRDEKVRLIGEVWASLDDSFDPPLTRAQTTELEERLKSFTANPTNTIAWDDVDAKAQGILAGIKSALK